MVAVLLAALLGVAAGELQIAGEAAEVDVLTGSLFIVEAPPAPVKAPGHLRKCVKVIPPSVTLAAAVWAFFSKARLEGLATGLGEEAAEVAEQLHLSAHEPNQSEQETSSPLRLRWAGLLSLVAFGFAVLYRRRGKAKAQDAFLLAEHEPIVKRSGVQIFRISTEQPDEEPEPAHWKRMMSNLSDISDRPLELGNTTEVFRMQTQELLSSHSAGDVAGEGSSEKPSVQRLSSSSQSSPSVDALHEDAEEETQDEQTESSEPAEAQQAEPAESEQAEQAEQVEPTQPAQPAEQAKQAEPARLVAPSDQAADPSGQAAQRAPLLNEPTPVGSIVVAEEGARTVPAASEDVPSPSTQSAQSTAEAEPCSAAASLPSPRAQNEAETQNPVQAQPPEQRPSSIPPLGAEGTLADSGTEPRDRLRRSTAESRPETDSPQRGKVATKTPTQYPAADTPRRGLNSSLIGAPADKIREIAGHLTSGQPPSFSPSASRHESPEKKQKA